MEAKDKIKNKFVLLDTGIIIRAFEHFENFEVFFNFLEESDCAPVYFPFIEFEFLRSAYEPSHKELRKKFLKIITKTALDMPRESIVQDAIKIANAYSARKLHTPSLTDCCIAAYLKKYSDNLFFVTLNHKDFPTFLFERFYILPIDTDKDIYPLAFYEFNNVKAKKIGLN